MKTLRKILGMGLLLSLCMACLGCEQEKKDAYDGAVLLLENGFYEQAIEVFTELGDYKDSAEKKLEAQDKVYGPQYAVAFSLYLDKQYDAAYEVFITFGDYRDSQKKAEDCLAEIYRSAMEQYDAGKYVNGQKLFSWLAERGYKDSAKQADACEKAIKDHDYSAAAALKDAGKYEAAIQAFKAMNGYKDSAAQITACETAIKDRDYAAAVALMDAKKYEDAIKAFKAMNGYKESAAKIMTCEAAIKDRDYAAAVALMDAAKYDEALKAFKNLNGYKDSASQITACETAIRDRDYAAAVALMDAKKYEEAIGAFSALNGYKDSAKKIEEAKPLLLKSAKVGSVVWFGHYEQDNNTSNGKEEIEWIVLDKQGTKLLLISRYALDCQPYNPYNKDYQNVTWETCTLRPWLNGTFLNAAFSAAEQKKIVQTTVQNPDNSRYKTNGGNDTQDRVFLLSIDEANKYFSSDDARACAGTAYAYAQGAYKANNGNCCWWLRSAGDLLVAPFVDNDGNVHDYGISVSDDWSAVRPAFWIDLAS